VCMQRIWVLIDSYQAAGSAEMRFYGGNEFVYVFERVVSRNDLLYVVFSWCREGRRMVSCGVSSSN
jgi:hypothetical protein